MAQSIRISDEFYELAQAVSRSSGRSLAQQLEYWARLGARVDLGSTASQALALLDDGRQATALVARFLRNDVAAHTPGDAVAARHARHEGEVASGQRDAASLVVIPRAVAKSAKLTYPKGAFGGAQSW
jgi:hypothetical protein